MNDFTGFVVRYSNGVIYEQTNFYDPQLGKTCATNWHQIRQEDILALELWWEGKRKDIIKKDSCPGLNEWIFYHTGHTEKGITKTFSRTIGYKGSFGTYLFTVDEDTGFSKSSIIY